MIKKCLRTLPISFCWDGGCASDQKGLRNVCGLRKSEKEIWKQEKRMKQGGSLAREWINSLRIKIFRERTDIPDKLTAWRQKKEA